MTPAIATLSMICSTSLPLQLVFIPNRSSSAVDISTRSSNNVPSSERTPASANHSKASADFRPCNSPTEEAAPGRNVLMNLLCFSVCSLFSARPIRLSMIVLSISTPCSEADTAIPKAA